MSVIITKNGKQVASSQNLEVLSRYSRKPRIYVSKSTATKLPSGRGLLRVWFNDGAKSETEFASYNLLKDWLATKRKRSGWK